jgi:hypothetical protein
MSAVAVSGIMALDKVGGVGEIANMRATLLLRERHILEAGRFAEIVIWRLPSSTRRGPHTFKYRPAFVVDGVCVLRFDNEAGKGDHKHVGGREEIYRFVDTGRLIDDFWHEIENWRGE